jgi:hypothetical protein
MGPCAEEYTFPLNQLAIPTATLPVTGEFFQSLCDYTVHNAWKVEELGKWFPMMAPPEKRLAIEVEWPESVYASAKSLFVYPEYGMPERIFAHTWPSLRLLVYHNSDNTAVPASFAAFLESHPAVRVWVVNSLEMHPKARTLPLGYENRMWRCPEIAPDESLVEICRDDIKRRPISLCVPWCSSLTNPHRGRWLTMARFYEETVPGMAVLEHMPKEEYHEKLIHSLAVLCPSGNGADTHRLWESLYAGCWGIVEHNDHTKCLLEQYPALPLIPVEGPGDIGSLVLPKVAAPFHPMLLRTFWTLLFESYLV